MFLAGSQANLLRGSPEEEFRAIRAKIRSSAYRERFSLDSSWAVRLADLSEILLEQRPHIIHFCGHGSHSGEILLVGDGGAASPLGNEVLVELLRVLNDELRIVVLNACYTSAQARAIATVVDCAVGTSSVIEDSAGTEFASEFYQALGYGKSIQDAFDLALVRLMGLGVANAKTLVKLYSRDGVKPSEVFLITGEGQRGNPSPSQASQVAQS